MNVNEAVLTVATVLNLQQQILSLQNELAATREQLAAATTRATETNTDD